MIAREHVFNDWQMVFADIATQEGGWIRACLAGHPQYGIVLFRIRLDAEGSGNVKCCRMTDDAPWGVPGKHIVHSLADEEGFLHLFWGLFEKNQGGYAVDDGGDIDDDLSDQLRRLLGDIDADV